MYNLDFIIRSIPSVLIGDFYCAISCQLMDKKTDEKVKYTLMTVIMTSYRQLYYIQLYLRYFPYISMRSSKFRIH